MTIKPNDVAQVKFSQTRFRPGYDQGEVDRFLDTVALSIHEMQTELVIAQGRVAELATAGQHKTNELLQQIVNLLERMVSHD